MCALISVAAAAGLLICFFFFQAEDGIRDDLVTGVQTCALPIWTEVRRFAGRRQDAKFFIVEDEPPRRFAIRSEGGPAEARASFDLRPEGDGTLVLLALDVKLRGA